MKTKRDIGVDILESLGIDVRDACATKAVLTVEAGKFPVLEITRLVLPAVYDEEGEEFAQTLTRYTLVPKDAA